MKAYLESDVEREYVSGGFGRTADCPPRRLLALTDPKTTLILSLTSRSRVACAAISLIAALVSCTRSGTVRAGPRTFCESPTPVTRHRSYRSSRSTKRYSRSTRSSAKRSSVSRQIIETFRFSLRGFRRGATATSPRTAPGSRTTCDRTRVSPTASRVTSADVAFTYRAIFDPRNRVTSLEPYQRIRFPRDSGRSYRGDQIARTVECRRSRALCAGRLRVLHPSEARICRYESRRLAVGERSVWQRSVPREELAARRSDRFGAKSLLSAAPQTRTNRLTDRTESELEFRGAPVGRRRRWHADAPRTSRRPSAPPGFAC